MGKSINDLLIFLFFQALTDAFLYAKSVIHSLFGYIFRCKYMK